MNPLFENWRKYLEDNEVLLTEVSFDDAQKSLDSKSTQKIIKAYNYDQGLDPNDDIANKLSWLKQNIMGMIPSDIEDNQKALTLLWVLKNLRAGGATAEDYRQKLVRPDQGGHWLLAPLRRDLETYFQHNRFMEEKDINKLTLITLPWTVKDAKKEIEAHQDNQQHMDAEGGVEFFSGGWLRDEQGNVVKNKETKRLETVPGSNGWVIAALLNKGAACEIGKGTEWCTAVKDGRWYEEYSEPDDPLFVLEDKIGKERYQVHYGEDEFKGEDDYEVDPDKRLELHMLLYNSKASSKYPVIAKANTYFKAMDPESSPSELEYMSTLPDFDIRAAVAANPSSDPSTLDRLSKDHRPGVIHQAAMNPSLSDDTMMRLLSLDQHENANVLVHTGIAVNPNAPDEALIKLASHQSMLVRQRLLERERLPQEAFKKLFKDESHHIRDITAEHPAVSAETLDYATSVSDNASIKRIASHPNVSVETLIKLSDSESTMVARAVAGNKKTPTRIVKKLFNKWPDAERGSPGWGPPPEDLRTLDDDDLEKIQEQSTTSLFENWRKYVDKSPDSAVIDKIQEYVETVIEIPVRKIHMQSESKIVVELDTDSSEHSDSFSKLVEDRWKGSFEFDKLQNMGYDVRLTTLDEPPPLAASLTKTVL